MKFSLKIFISFFVATFLLGSALIWIGERHVAKQTREEFISRYLVFSKVMGNTLTRLDQNTEALMFNAAKVIQAREMSEGVLSAKALETLRSELNVTHAFVIDKDGKYIRSTNEDPNLIPNVYSFCGDYRNMIAGTSETEATPIIRPNPEPKPYKFLFIPSFDHKRLLEVGVRVDFAAKTLTEALGSDENILSMSLYEPNGGSFGKFTSKDVDFKTPKVELPSEFPKVIDSADAFHFFTKVTSSHPKCCQCDVSGSSKGGEYYYVLEAEVSKKELSAILARTTDIFIFLAFCNLIFALLIARFLSRRLVRNIEVAADKVRFLKKSGDLKGRLGLGGKDEVAFLTDEFDRLLDTLEVSQKKVVEAEIVETRVQLAREIAHNIQSPVVALEMMIPSLINLPEKIQKVFKDSAREIKGLAERLSQQADILTPQALKIVIPKELVQLSEILQQIVDEKRIEYNSLPEMKLLADFSKNHGRDRVLIDSLEFKCIVSK